MILNPQLKEIKRGFFKADENGNLIPANKEALDLQNKNYEVGFDTTQTSNNATVYPSEQIQKLTEEDIKNLTTEEKDPEKIIEQIQKNNANFEKRTDFSKQKYLDKKNKKYNLILKVEICDLGNLNKMFVTDRKDYIFPREDYLAFVLNSVHPENGENMFVAERARGTILSGLLQKIEESEESKVVLFNAKMENADITKYEAVKCLNLTEQFKTKVIYKNATTIDSISQKLHYAVIACDENELWIIEKIEKHFAFNTEVIVFTNYHETATAVYEFLASKKTYINLLMNDYMYREIQAWPMRSHPTMMGNTSTGYLVSGIYVNTSEK